MARLHRFMASWLGFMASWLSLMARLHGFMASWIHGFMDSWLHKFMASWIHSLTTIIGIAPRDLLASVEPPNEDAQGQEGAMRAI
jgi:hypothetical protein